ncbi:protein ImuA [Paraburkholderia sp. JPY465]|uniref:translesion DNA synthesis-associated protein ImuA n=1 Tax=Paraburkholderia sp. JPY465 TaxID=3042285 RepID=UPI003D1B9F64
MSALPRHVEEIHPSLWRASQLARSAGRTVSTGHDHLSRELPGGGWPVGALTELLLSQPGIGELRLLQPALSAAAKRPIVLININPPHNPGVIGLSYIGVPVDKLMTLQPQNAADALWATEQVLKANTCGAVLLWQQHMRADSLRRLSLHAQASDVLFIALRPLITLHDASPAALRLALRPAVNGINVEIIKRKGPVGIEPFDLVLKPSPVLLSPHGRMTRPARKVAPVQSPQPETVD